MARLGHGIGEYYLMAQLGHVIGLKPKWKSN